MDCNTCKERKRQAQPVPFQDHQADMARAERANRRLAVIAAFLAVACLVLGVLLYTSGVNAENKLNEAHLAAQAALNENNRRWIEMWEQYDFESYEYQQDGEGVNIIGNLNGVEYHGSTSKNSQEGAEESGGER